MRTGVVLAGGAGVRMGAFKPLLPFRGRPMLAYALDALAPLCGELLVMAGARAAEVSRVAPGARVLADAQEGPVAALRQAAALARGDVLLTAPADAPFLTAEIYAPLLEAGPNATFARDGMPDPMVGCYRRADILAFTGRSLQSLAARRIDAGALAPQLRDLDTREELAQQGDVQSTSRR